MVVDMHNLQCTYPLVPRSAATVDLDRHLVTIRPWMTRAATWIRGAARTAGGRNAIASNRVAVVGRTQHTHPGADLARWSR